MSILMCSLMSQLFLKNDVDTTGRNTIDNEIIRQGSVMPAWKRDPDDPAVHQFNDRVGQRSSQPAIRPACSTPKLTPAPSSSGLTRGSTLASVSHGHGFQAQGLE